MIDGGFFQGVLNTQASNCYLYRGFQVKSQLGKRAKRIYLLGCGKWEDKVSLAGTCKKHQIPSGGNR